MCVCAHVYALATCALATCALATILGINSIRHFHSLHYIVAISSSVWGKRRWPVTQPLTLDFEESLQQHQ